MAKLPNEDILGGLPGISVPGGLPTAGGAEVGAAYQNLGRGLQGLSLGFQEALKDQQDYDAAIAQSEYSIADGKLYSAANQSEDYERAPREYSESSQTALVNIARQYIHDPKRQAEFIAKNSVRKEAQFNVLDNYAFRKRNEAQVLANDGRISELVSDGIQAVADPDYPRWGYFHDRIQEARDIIETESRVMKRTPAAHQRRMRQFLGDASKEAIKAIMLKSPEAAKRILDSLTPGPADEIAPGTGKFDRSMFQQELDKNPALADRLQVIVQGEVGRNASPDKKLIQLETIFNRAAARGQTLEQVTREYTGPGSDGYYPPETFRNGKIYGDAERSDFRENILDKALAGSDRSTELLGFPATGNASQGVAARGATSGRYKQYASLEGAAPGSPGVETYVSGHGNDNLERLNATRVAEGQKIPGVMISDSTGLMFKPSEVIQLQRQADSLIRSRARDAQLAKARETAEAKAASTEEVLRLMPLINKHDPSVTFEKIWEDSPDNPLTLEHRRLLDATLTRKEKPEPDRVRSAATSRELTDKINKDEITSPDPIMKRYVDGDLSSPDLDRTLKRLQERLAGRDSALEKRIVQMVDRAKVQFYKNLSVPDIQGSAYLDAWEYDLRSKVREMRETGKGNPEDLLNPHSKEYFLSPDVVNSYKRSPIEAARDLTKQFRRGSQAVPSPDLKAKPGESMDDYLKRRGL